MFGKEKNPELSGPHLRLTMILILALCYSFCLFKAKLMAVLIQKF